MIKASRNVHENINKTFFFNLVVLKSTVLLQFCYNSKMQVGMAAYFLAADFLGRTSAWIFAPSCVTGQLEDLTCVVLHDGRRVHGGTCPDTPYIVSFTEETVNTAYWELESGTARSRLCLCTGLSSFTTTRHNLLYEKLRTDRFYECLGIFLCLNLELG